MRVAERGMRRNWQRTPMGTEVRWVGEVRMVVKSDRWRVIPVPSMTPANIYVIQLPRLTQFNVFGTSDPRMADPRTKKGKRDVSCDKIWSILGITASAGVSDFSMDGGGDASPRSSSGEEERFNFVTLFVGLRLLHLFICNTLRDDVIVNDNADDHSDADDGES